jgi:NAD(P)-dependent dehydrogenase (short-subunit alcohol dehydrogenase family)
MKTFVITGGSGGLGQCIQSALVGSVFAAPRDVVDWSLETGINIISEHSVRDAMKRLPFETIDCVIHCAGVNLLAGIDQVDFTHWHNHMLVNAYGIVNVTRILMPRLWSSSTVLGVISNAAHNPMSNSLAYNASKAAAEMAIRQMAHELGRKYCDMTVFGINPNKLAGTPMSESVDQQAAHLNKRTIEQTREYQLAKLPARMETDPKVLAEFIAFLLSDKERHKYLHGCIIPYGGPQ